MGAQVRVGCAKEKLPRPLPSRYDTIEGLGGRWDGAGCPSISQGPDKSGPCAPCHAGSAEARD